MCRRPRARPWLLLALTRTTHAWHEGHRVLGFEHLLSAPSYAGLLHGGTHGGNGSSAPGGNGSSAPGGNGSSTPGGNGSSTAEAAEAELFYWLFLAQNGKSNAPVVVWMNGGPGLSSPPPPPPPAPRLTST